MAEFEDKDLEASEETSDETVEEVAVEEKSNTSVATKKAKKSEEKKPGFFKRLGARLKKFWKSYKRELKNITWYSRKQTFTGTVLVLVCMLAIAVVIGILDFGFSQGIEGLAKLIG